MPRSSQAVIYAVGTSPRRHSQTSDAEWRASLPAHAHVLQLLANGADVRRLYDPDPAARAAVVARLRQRLAHFRPSDMVLLDGPPLVAAFTAAILAGEHPLDRITFVTYSLGERRYVTATLTLGPLPTFDPIARSTTTTTHTEEDV